VRTRAGNFQAGSGWVLAQVPQRPAQNAVASRLTRARLAGAEAYRGRGPRWRCGRAARISPGSRSARDDRRAGTHLTRRGRLVVISLFTILLALAFGAGRVSAVPVRSAPRPTVVVQPGDTMWSIAARVASGGDVRARVEQIAALNGVAAQALVPGEQLAVPDG